MKYFRLLLVLLLISCVDVYSQNRDSVNVTMGVEALQEDLIRIAKQYLGVPYKYGSAGPNLFDCSGFTGYVYAKLGYSLPRSSREQSLVGTAVPKDFSSLQKGDILVFGSRKHPGVVGHVGLFIALDETGNDFTFIHAAHSGVIISHYSEAYYKQRYLCARRIFSDSVVCRAASYAKQNNEILTPVDTIKQIDLTSDSQQIVLQSDGSWVVLDEDGSAYKPDLDKRILLLEDGSWLEMATPPYAVKENTTTQKLEEKADTTTQTPNTQITNVEPEPVYHVVRSGDTLYSLAKKNQTSVHAICKLNGISEKNPVIRVGQKIRIK